MKHDSSMNIALPSAACGIATGVDGVVESLEKAGTVLRPEGGVRYTNVQLLVPPKPHIIQFLMAGQESHTIRKAFVEGLNEPESAFPWIEDRRLPKNSSPKRQPEPHNVGKNAWTSRKSLEVQTLSFL